MSRFRTASTGAVIWAAAVALFTAMVGVLLFSTVATPDHFKPRLVALEAQLAELNRGNAIRAEPDLLPSGAICGGSVEKQMQLLRQAVGVAAQGRKLALSDLQVGLDRQDRLGDTLVPLRVRLQAQGDYEGTIGLLQALSDLRPILFADNVDLTSNTSSVTLKLSGRVFCGV